MLVKTHILAFHVDESTMPTVVVGDDRFCVLREIQWENDDGRVSQLALVADEKSK